MHTTMNDNLTHIIYAKVPVTFINSQTECFCEPHVKKKTIASYTRVILDHPLYFSSNGYSLNLGKGLSWTASSVDLETQANSR